MDTSTAPNPAMYFQFSTASEGRQHNRSNVENEGGGEEAEENAHADARRRFITTQRRTKSA